MSLTAMLTELGATDPPRQAALLTSLSAAD